MKLVPAIILALTLATGAHAVDNKLPRGNFCQLMTIGVGVYEPLPESDPQKARDRCGDRVLIFTPGGYEVLEAGCKYISVKIWYDPSISTETKSPTALRGAWVSRTISKCGGEGCTWREKAIMHEAKGYLFFRTRHL